MLLPFAAFLLLVSIARSEGTADTHASASRAIAEVPRCDSTEACRVEALLAKLSIEEKIDLLGGVEGNSIRAVPSIGLPQLLMSDGPYGVGGAGLSTAYAGGMATAASWDPELARRFGVSVGRDARAQGVHFVLAPGVNLQRAPLNGRNFEYFGEDPYLATRLAVSYIEGVQSEGVVATVKHFTANNSELDRKTVSSDVDERTLREAYFPMFEAAVKEAQVGAVMSAYNRVNGTFAGENTELNLQILKQEWGFNGILMSDWGGIHDGIAAANAGLDLEMPEGAHLSREVLLSAIRARAVSPETIDDKVRRILRIAIRFGFIDHNQWRPDLPIYSQESKAVALDQARAGIVLLKNQDGILPLDPARINTVALIGPNAARPVTSGGGSAFVNSFLPKSFLIGISDFLGTKVNVLHTAGLPSAVDVMRGTKFAPPGLTGEMFATPDFTGAPVATTHATYLDQFKSELWGSKAKQARGIRWTGTFVAPKAGPYLLLVGAGSSDAYTLYIDGQSLIVQPHREGQAAAWRILDLKENQSISVRLDYVQDSQRFRCGLGLVPMDELVTKEAKRIAALADVVVVCSGFDDTSESEGFDRTFGLPWGQDRLIAEVAGINPRTVVTVTSGGSVGMLPWLGKVPGLLATWYPGQEGGTALAEILFGARSPEGRLPVTFERSWDQSPVRDHYQPTIDAVTGLLHVRYAEGLFFGYRYYTSAGKEPLFPFGFGLSYTAFEFTDLEIKVLGTLANGADVTFRVKNTGNRASAEVAQVYVSQMAPKLPRPVRELKNFAKVRLAPGESRAVTVHLDARAFSYWDVETHAWKMDPDRFVIQVGRSSVDLPLESTVDFSRGPP